MWAFRSDLVVPLLLFSLISLDQSWKISCLQAPGLVPGPVARFAALAANLGPAPATILARVPYSPACETPAANAFHVAFYDAVQMMSLVTSTLQIMRRIMKSICQNLRQCRLMIASCNRLKSVLTKTSANSTIPVRGTFFFLLNFC